MKHRISRILRFAIFALLFFGIFGLVVMGLWNWLMPALFRLPAITYWQALGLLILSKILFGSFRGHRGSWRHRMIERWEKMTPEEREKFRQGLETRCGHSPAPAEPAK
jgi:hypothetical protein